MEGVEKVLIKFPTSVFQTFGQSLGIVKTVSQTAIIALIAYYLVHSGIISKASFKKVLKIIKPEQKEELFNIYVPEEFPFDIEIPPQDKWKAKSINALLPFLVKSVSKHVKKYANYKSKSSEERLIDDIVSDLEKDDR